MTTTEAKIIQAANDRVRRGGRLVIDHWIGVRERFSFLFNPEKDNHTHRQAALYHDAIEDHYATEGDLRKFLSEDTIDLIKILTHGDEPYMDYIRKIKQNKIATQIKIADILDNLSDKPTLAQIKKYGEALFELTS